MTDRQVLVELLAIAAYNMFDGGIPWSDTHPEDKDMYRSVVDNCPSPDAMWVVFGERMVS